jgi:DNA processing protein
MESGEIEPASLPLWLTLAGATQASGCRSDLPAGAIADPAALLARLAAAGTPAAPVAAARIAACEAWLGRPDTRLVTWNSRHYPDRLAELPDAPPVLFVEGQVGALRADCQVAIIGSRRASPGGLEQARYLAAGLAAAGVVVVSGLALGIDAAAHRGSLAVGGAGLAVLGSGPDRIYPRQHGTLAAELSQSGLLISEFPPGTPPRAHHFPRRNRIISGLSVAVVVVEAALPSGSLITARLALDQGREVLAVPGSVFNPQARGCHALIRAGARLVETVEDVLEELPGFSVPLLLAPLAARTEPQSPSHPLLRHLGHEAVGIDILVERSGLTVSEVSSILQALELAGQVVSGPAGTFQRKPMRT